jgi:ribonuclease-3
MATLWEIKPELYREAVRIQESLGFGADPFDDFLRAVTHRSAVRDAHNRDGWNERLEFLGDAVIGLVVAEELYNHAEKFSEGVMSKLRAKVVCEASLADIARSIGLDRAIVLGSSEHRAGGQDKNSILADAFEAVIGALCLNVNFETVKLFVKKVFSSLLEVHLDADVSTDFKTTLQEYTQQMEKKAPIYEVVKESGPPHKRVFAMRVLLSERELGRGFGASKKEATQAAAKDALDKVRNAPLEQGSGGMTL